MFKKQNKIDIFDTDESIYILEELNAELSQGIYRSNMEEIETKFSIGNKLKKNKSLVGKINNEDKYYLLFAEKYNSIDEAIDEMELGLVASWSKIKKHLKENNNEEKIKR